MNSIIKHESPADHIGRHGQGISCLYQLLIIVLFLLWWSSTKFPDGNFLHCD